jgi:hypothetical protein
MDPLYTIKAFYLMLGRRMRHIRDFGIPVDLYFSSLNLHASLTDCETNS